MTYPPEIPFHPLLLAVSILGGPVVDPASGRRYLLLKEAPWPESEQAARELGGHLVSIGDAREQEWVFGTFGAFGGVERSLWIGLSRTGSGGPFAWSDGSPFLYSNWLPSQPDDALGGEPYVHMISRSNTYGHPGGTWNDLGTPGSPFRDFDPVCGVVELPPLTLEWVASRADGSLRVSCPTLPGFLYRILRTDDPVSGTWVDTGVASLGDGGTWTAELPSTTAPVRFYRVVEAMASVSGSPTVPGGSDVAFTPR